MTGLDTILEAVPLRLQTAIRTPRSMFGNFANIVGAMLSATFETSCSLVSRRGVTTSKIFSNPSSPRRPRHVIAKFCKLLRD